MKMLHLILKEITHRKVNALLMLSGVVVAVGCLIAAVALLQWYSLETDKRMAELTADFKKIALHAGFNVFIVPEKSDSGRLDADMPEDYVTKLANADIITIDHLLPSLSVNMVWQEANATQITLTGVRGEVAIAGKKRKRPLIQPVAPDKMVLGAKIAKQAKLSKGSQVSLLGKNFTVSMVHNVRGSADDFTVWIDLSAAQKLLNREGKITAIQAINCLAPNCHPDATGIPTVNAEIAKVLPDTDVVIDIGKATARIEARQRSAAEAEAGRAATEKITTVLVPVVILATVVWIGLLALTNVRDRRNEIGVLRALGVKSMSIIGLFLGKSIMISAAGALSGFAVGIAVACVYAQTSMDVLFNGELLAAVLIGTPLVAAMAAWLPSMLAAKQDPAIVLCSE